MSKTFEELGVIKKDISIKRKLELNKSKSNVSYDGFVVNYCLNEEEAKYLKSIIKDNVEVKRYYKIKIRKEYYKNNLDFIMRSDVYHNIIHIDKFYNNGVCIDDNMHIMSIICEKEDERYKDIRSGIIFEENPMIEIEEINLDDVLNELKNHTSKEDIMKYTINLNRVLKDIKLIDEEYKLYCEVIQREINKTLELIRDN